MRLLVCGSREYANRDEMHRILDKLADLLLIDLVIEGEARGADQMAAEWAQGRYIPVQAYPADWDTLGRAAGPARNRRMLIDGKPDLVVAFPVDLTVSRGTANMIEQARRVGTPVWVMPADEAKIDALGEKEYSYDAAGAQRPWGSRASRSRSSSGSAAPSSSS